MLLEALALPEAGKPSDFIAFRDRIQSPALRALADDWNEARGTRRMPDWSDIKPSPTAPYLGGIWAIDYDRTDQEFFGRLAGSNIVLHTGQTYLGTSLRDLYLPHVYELVRAHLLRVISEPACVRYTGKLFRTADQIVEGERLVLPMGADAQNPDGVLGASHYDNSPLSHIAAPVELLSDVAHWCKV